MLKSESNSLYGTIEFSIIEFNTIEFNTIEFSTTEFYTIMLLSIDHQDRLNAPHDHINTPQVRVKPAGFCQFIRECVYHRIWW